MTIQSWDLPHTLGALRHSRFSEDEVAARTVKDELRDNLIRKLEHARTPVPRSRRF